MSENKKNEDVFEELNQELDENKITLKVDYAPLVDTIKISKQDFGNSSTYYAVAVVKGVGEIKVRLKQKDEGFITYASVCQKRNITPFTSKSLVREFSEEKQYFFTCIKYVSNQGNVYRFFIDRAYEEVLGMVYDEYLKTKKGE